MEDPNFLIRRLRLKKTPANIGALIIGALTILAWVVMLVGPGGHAGVATFAIAMPFLILGWIMGAAVLNAVGFDPNNHLAIWYTLMFPTTIMLNAVVVWVVLAVATKIIGFFRARTPLS